MFVHIMCGMMTLDGGGQTTKNDRLSYKAEIGFRPIGQDNTMYPGDRRALQRTTR